MGTFKPPFIHESLAYFYSMQMAVFFALRDVIRHNYLTIVEIGVFYQRQHGKTRRQVFISDSEDKAEGDIVVFQPGTTSV